MTGPAARVSVVIPAYRAGETICRAVDSVLAQTGAATEIIVVDDGSPDDTAGVVERAYGERVIVVRQPNGGAASARNAGIERATSHFIAFLDADDYWEPQKLDRQLAVFARHPEVGLVAGAFFEQEPGKERQAAAPRVANLPWDRVTRSRGPEAFRLATAVWTGTVMMRRSALSSERFVSGLEPAEDRDLWARIMTTCATYLMSEPLATAVLEPGSISRSSIERDCTNMLRVVARHAKSLGRSRSRLWQSHTLYRWAANDPNPFSALPRLAQSVWLWPLPYWEGPDAPRLGRLKRLLVLLAKASGVRT
jgi:glycosyltransferase involved in cell wall biosynthesis